MVLIGITVVVVLIIKSCSGKEDTADSVQSTNNNSNGSGSTRNNTSKIDSTLLDEADENLRMPRRLMMRKIIQKPPSRKAGRHFRIIFR